MGKKTQMKISGVKVMIFDKIDFGFWCNFKQITLDKYNLHWLFILAFSIGTSYDYL